MSDKVKPWHNRKPRDKKNKRIVPLRSGGNERVVPLRSGGDNRIVPLRTGDPSSYEEDWWDDEEQGSF